MVRASLCSICQGDATRGGRRDRTPAAAITGSSRMGRSSRTSPRDFGRAVEEPDRVEDAKVRRLQSEPAIERASNYVALDWTSPSLVSESMQALISS